MAMKKGGLGKGLDALFADNSIEETGVGQSVKLKLMDIETNPDQPRKNFKDEALAELADSIARHGVLQPLLVRPLPSGGYQLVAGERRWRASRIAGLTEVPVIIKEMDDREAAVFSLIENLQREDLDPIEEAKGYRKLIDDFDLSQEEAAGLVGKSRPVITNALRLLKLPEEVIALVTDGTLSAGHARALAGLEGEEKILNAAKIVVTKKLSVRETEKLVKALNTEKKTAKARTSRDSFFDEVELALNNSLGRKARVITKSGKEAGTLEISFYSKDDLAVIAAALEALE